MKLITQAIEKGEIHLFLMGIGKYKMEGWSDLPEPTDYSKCWRTEIIPYYNKNNEYFKRGKFDAILIDLLNYEEDANRGIYTALQTMTWALYFSEQKLIKFDIEYPQISSAIKKALDKNTESLKEDKRWSGVEWNSQTGLLEPIQRVLTSIKNSIPEFEV